MSLIRRTLDWVREELTIRALQNSNWSATKLRDLMHTYGIKIVDEELELRYLLSDQKQDPLKVFDLADENVIDEVFDFILSLEDHLARSTRSSGEEKDQNPIISDKNR